MSRESSKPRWRAPTQKSVERALRGARAAGFEPEEVRVGPDGEIRLLARRGDGAFVSNSEIQDELTSHFAHARF